MKKEEFAHIFNMLEINEKKLTALANEVGFIKRIRKVDSIDFLYSLSMESIKGIASCNDIAAAIEADGNISLSRQAIWKKLTNSCLEYIKLVLELVILNKIHYQDKILNCIFERVLVQDSTIIRLPDKLFSLFSGVSNGLTSVCHARIQGIYDLLSGKFISFSIDPYSRNDQDAAIEMEIRNNDLTLRDRGYLSINEIKRHLSCGAHFIYRHKLKMALLDPETKKPIDLYSRLVKEDKLDILVLLNDNENTIIRLVASPVSEKLANSRRMKLKREMRGHQPCKQLLQLQSWTIFLTTIKPDLADFETLFEIYSLRWRIEIIFKSWKSNFRFDFIHNVSGIQLQLIIISRLIMILIITQIVYPICKILIHNLIESELSILKLTNYLSRNPAKLFDILKELTKRSGHIGKSIGSIARHCVYDKRQRLNFMQKMEILSLS
jgi:hypothetical protein